MKFTIVRLLSFFQVKGFYDLSVYITFDVWRLSHRRTPVYHFIVTYVLQKFVSCVQTVNKIDEILRKIV